MTGLRASGVSVLRGGRALLDSVDAAVTPRELVAVAGRNGAGKSTLCRVLAGLWRPDRGAAMLDGEDLRAVVPKAVARRRAFLPQREELVAPLRAREVVALGRWPHGGGDPASAVVTESLRRVGASAVADAPMDTLSGGERQRVHLARAWCQLESGGQPGYLLLDEPTSALDPAGQLVVGEVLRSLVADGHGVLVVLHDLDLAGAWADRVVVLHAGRVLAEGSPEQVLTPTTLGAAFGVRFAVRPHPESGRPQCSVLGPLPLPRPPIG